ncbi:13147_t:CDS:1, partial [Gigaspora rosea]
NTAKLDSDTQTKGVSSTSINKSKLNSLPVLIEYSLAWSNKLFIMMKKFAR